MPAVKLPDGTTVNLPDGATNDQINEFLGTLDASKMVAPASPTARVKPVSAGPQSDLSRKRLANIQGEQAAANYDQDIRNAYGTALSTAGKAAVVGGIGLGTGGMGVAPAMGLMGLGGALSHEVGNQLKATVGSNELPMDWKQELKGLAWDSGTAAAGQGLGSAVGGLLTKVTPALIKRAAATTNDGNAALNDLFVSMRDRFYSIVGQHAPPPINIERDLHEALVGLGAIPKGKGPIGQRFSGPTERAVEIMDTIKDSLGTTTSAGTPISSQPLDALIRMKSSINSVAYSGKELAQEEAAVLRTLASKLDGKIRGAINALPGDARAAAMDAYVAQNSIAKSLNEHNAVVKLSEKLLGMAGGGATGAIAGAGLGYQQGKSTGAALKGAAAGAILGVGVPTAAQFAVRLIAENPAAMYAAKQATRYAVEGEGKKSLGLMARAFALAGVRERFKEAGRGTIAPDEGLGPQVSPNYGDQGSR